MPDAPLKDLTMKHTLHLAPVNGGPFNCIPARSVELEDDRISICGESCGLAFPGQSGGSLWVIGNEFGALGAVVAAHEQEAFDTLCDRGLAAGLACEEPENEEEAEDITRLGNAGEPHDLTNAWIQRVDLDPARDIQLIVALARADGANVTFLSQA